MQSMLDREYPSDLRVIGLNVAIWGSSLIAIVLAGVTVSLVSSYEGIVAHQPKTPQISSVRIADARASAPSNPSALTPPGDPSSRVRPLTNHRI
jgi:hypothetical protein